MRQIGLPAVRAEVQPAARTLVNIETVFFAQAGEFRRSVSLLGQNVDIVAVPARFTWVHGDGTSQTTTSAGHAYPSADVTHRYVRAAQAVSAHVSVGYRVTYRINGGAWTPLDTVITSTGPDTTFAVDEARGVLVAP